MKALRMLSKRQSWDTALQDKRDQDRVSLTEAYEVEKFLAFYCRKRGLDRRSVDAALRALLVEYAASETSRLRWDIEGWLDRKQGIATPFCMWTYLRRRQYEQRRRRSLFGLKK